MERTEYVVTTLADSGPGSLRHGLSLPDAATITFAVDGVILLESELTVTTTLAVFGNGPTRTLLDGQDTHRVLRVAEGADLTLRGVTIRNGRAPGTDSGGGLLNLGSVRIEDSVLTGNYAFNGGAFASFLGSATVSNVTFQGNQAEGGGAIDNGAPLTIRDSRITANKATNSAGGIYTNAPATMENVRIEDNKVSGGNGGGLYQDDGPVQIRNSTLHNNSATGTGGGFHLAGGQLAINRTPVTNNTASFAGAGFVHVDGNLSIGDSTLSGNDATESSGALRNLGNTTIRTTQIHNNTGKVAGAILNGGTMRIEDSAVTDNRAEVVLGGIGNGGTLLVLRTPIYDNSADALRNRVETAAPAAAALTGANAKHLTGSVAALGEGTYRIDAYGTAVADCDADPANRTTRVFLGSVEVAVPAAPTPGQGSFQVPLAAGDHERVIATTTRLTGPGDNRGTSLPSACLAPANDIAGGGGAPPTPSERVDRDAVAVPPGDGASHTWRTSPAAVKAQGTLGVTFPDTSIIECIEIIFIEETPHVVVEAHALAGPPGVPLAEGFDGVAFVHIQLNGRTGPLAPEAVAEARITLRIALEEGANADHLVVLRLGADGVWRAHTTKTIEATDHVGRILGTLPGFSVIAVAKDTWAPVIHVEGLDAMNATIGRNGSIVVRIDDNRGGLDVRMEIDGVAVAIALEDDVFIHRPAVPFASGAHRLVVRARDASGLESMVDVAFTVPAQNDPEPFVVDTDDTKPKEPMSIGAIIAVGLVAAMAALAYLQRDRLATALSALRGRLPAATAARAERIHRVATRAGYVTTEAPADSLHQLALASARLGRSKRRYLDLFDAVGRGHCHETEPECGGCVLGDRCPFATAHRAQSEAAAVRAAGTPPRE